MTNIAPDRLTEIAALADALPEKYQVAAFQEMVRYELDKTEPRPRDRKPSIRVADEETTPPPPSTPPWFDDVLEKMPEQHLVASGNREGQAAWALVELYRTGEPGTPAACRRLIKDVLGVTPEGRTHMSNRLGKDFTPRYATRYPVEKGQGYRYEPTRNIVEMFPKEQEVE